MTNVTNVLVKKKHFKKEFWIIVSLITSEMIWKHLKPFFRESEWNLGITMHTFKWCIFHILLNVISFEFKLIFHFMSIYAQHLCRLYQYNCLMVLNFKYFSQKFHVLLKKKCNYIFNDFQRLFMKENFKVIEFEVCCIFE